MDKEWKKDVVDVRREMGNDESCLGGDAVSCSKPV